VTAPTPEPTSDQKQLLYFADPMCSWCWGFSPVIAGIAELHGDGLPIRPIMGGLRLGSDKAMTQEAKDEIRGHWEHVHEGTGQPFNFDFFDRDDFVYDTELACRAVVTARGVEPRLGLSMLARLHQAFYAENQDITDHDTVVALAVDDGLDEAAFTRTFDSDEAKQVTASDFQITQKLGVTGFPTLLAGTYDEGFGLVTTGYRPLEEIAGSIAEWLEEKSD
jgi:putative protein-disulfide isomerase